MNAAGIASFSRRIMPLILPVVLGACFLLAPRAGGAADTDPGAEATWAAARALAATIDAELASRWALQNVVPAAPAGDAEFVRRVYLDLTGRIPSISEVRDFLEDQSADRREKLVDRLLDGPAFSNHFARIWRASLIPEADSNPQIRFIGVTVESWLRTQLRNGEGYDKIVRGLLTVPVGQNGNAANPFDRQVTSPIAFYFAKEGKPENLAATTARTFLGVRLECAQCHDHPFAHWKQEQFWQLASFFAGIERQQQNADFSPLKENAARHELRIPDTNRDVTATFLDGTAPAWDEKSVARDKLADWVTARDNRYFSRALANRVWAHFFGIGLVDPVDDLDENNPPSHPALLEVLAERLASHEFRLPYLIRAVTTSRAYQLTSVVTSDTQRDPRRFAVMPVRGLSAEQLFDSLAVAVGYHDPLAPNGQEALALGTPRSTFLELFANQRDKPLEYDTSIIQAMAIMNGQFVADATSFDRGATLAAIARFPGFDSRERLEAMFLATVSRPPREDELERLEKYVAEVDAQGKTYKQEDRLGDIFWALLNSSEFLFNH